MTIYLKMMSDYDLPDESTAKPYELVPVPEKSRISFNRTEYGEPMITLTDPDGSFEEFYPKGNSYVVENRRTVSTFAYTEYPSEENIGLINDRIEELDREVFEKFMDHQELNHFLAVINAIPKTPAMVRTCRLYGSSTPIRVDEEDILKEYLAAFGFQYCGSAMVGTKHPSGMIEEHLTEITVCIP